MSNNKFESLLELLINEENDKAEALFHEIVVEKSRDIYENLADEEVTAEAMHDKKMKKEDEVIASYFKEVKIKELRIWKGDMRSLAGTVSDDSYLLTGGKPRKKILGEANAKVKKLKRSHEKDLKRESLSG